MILHGNHKIMCKASVLYDHTYEYCMGYQLRIHTEVTNTSGGARGTSDGRILGVRVLDDSLRDHPYSVWLKMGDLGQGLISK